MHAALTLMFARGFLANGPVRVALVVGGGAAVVCAVVGVFTVMRGQSFAGHALADVSSAGGSAAFLLGISPLFGFLGMSALAAGGMEWADVRDARERDLLTGVMLGLGLGLTALFLYLGTASGSMSGAAITVLFGPTVRAPVRAICWDKCVLAMARQTVADSLFIRRPLPDYGAVRIFNTNPPQRKQLIQAVARHRGHDLLVRVESCEAQVVHGCVRDGHGGGVPPMTEHLAKPRDALRSQCEQEAVGV